MQELWTSDVDGRFHIVLYLVAHISDVVIDVVSVLQQNKL